MTKKGIFWSKRPFLGSKNDQKRAKMKFCLKGVFHTLLVKFKQKRAEKSKNMASTGTPRDGARINTPHD